MSIKETSDLWDAYCTGWDAAIRRVAFILKPGADRDAILALQKGAEPLKPFPCPSGSTFL